MDSMLDNNRKVIVAFISDMMTTIQVQKVCEYLDFRLRFIDDASAVSGAESSGTHPRAEPLFGREARLIELITSLQPRLLIFDLSNEAIPWRKWISILKSSPATRRTPILCFGPHIDKEAFKAAKNLKVDMVVARSRFMSRMPLLIGESVSKDNSEEIKEACSEPISPVALVGLEAFNNGQFFEAHEYLEEAWIADRSASRSVYKGVLQIAVAYLQIERGNYRGAAKMFLRARQWLSPLPDVCRGINIAQLRLDANNVHQMLLDSGSEGFNNIDIRQFPPLDFVQPK